MTRILLLGAGFSRNWGGWLANEAFEYLLGCPEIDDAIRRRLWSAHIDGGGFEGALADLQKEAGDTGVDEPLRSLEAALVGMFGTMNQGFAKTSLDNPALIDFLAEFDAIFTLNQDLLLERHYLHRHPARSRAGRTGARVPGIKRLDPNQPGLSPADDLAAMHVPADHRTDPVTQPYFKLHGSSNWLDGNGGRLLIMGGDKAASIGKHPLLTWYHEQFNAFASRPDARLMVIGYSFGDQHINEIIEAATRDAGLRLFIVDPAGVNVLFLRDPMRGEHPSARRLLNALGPFVVGASRRDLNETFGADEVERTKLWRFIAP